MKKSPAKSLAMPRQEPLLRNFKGWKLEEAKARLSEVVRQAQDSPQRITVHGQDAVILVSARTFAEMLPASSEKSLHVLLSSSPLAEIDFDFESVRSPVREPEL